MQVDRQILAGLLHGRRHKPLNELGVGSSLTLECVGRKPLAVSEHIPSEDVTGRRFFNRRGSRGIGQQGILRVEGELHVRRLAELCGVLRGLQNLDLLNTEDSRDHLLVDECRVRRGSGSFDSLEELRMVLHRDKRVITKRQLVRQPAASKKDIPLVIIEQADDVAVRIGEMQELIGGRGGSNTGVRASGKY